MKIEAVPASLESPLCRAELHAGAATGDTIRAHQLRAPNSPGIGSDALTLEFPVGMNAVDYSVVGPRVAFPEPTEAFRIGSRIAWTFATSVRISRTLPDHDPDLPGLLPFPRAMISSAATSENRFLQTSLRKHLVDVIRASEGVVFEDGTLSHVARSVLWSVESFARDAVSAIAEVLADPSIGSEVATEILRRLGRPAEPTSRGPRRELLVSYLSARNARLRFASATGLGELRDVNARSSLTTALNDERDPLIQAHYRRVLSVLERTSQWPAS